MIDLLKHIQARMRPYGVSGLLAGVMLCAGLAMFAPAAVYGANCPVNADPTKPCIGDAPKQANCDPAVPKTVCREGVDCAGSDCGLVARYGSPIVTFLCGFAAIVAAISLTTGAIQYSSSSDEPQKVAAAKNRMYNAVLGFLGFLFLWAFLQWLIPGGVLNT